MKTTLALVVGLLGLSLLPGSAHAINQVFETALGSATLVNVEISTTSGSVQVDAGPNRDLPSRFSIEIYNDDSADALRCSFDTNVSTITSPSINANLGRKVAPGTSWTITIPDVIPVYCRVEGSGTAAAAIAIITQLH